MDVCNFFSFKSPLISVQNRAFRTFFIPFLSAGLILFSSSWLIACKAPDKQSISISTPRSALTSLLWLTDELGFFKQQGLNIELHPYPSGKRALMAMLRGEEELAATAETPFVIASFKRDDIRLYASMGQSDNELRILARRDHGITRPADLTGKVIATQENSAVHFFLTSFLLYHQLESTAVKTIFMKAEMLPDALASGDIDAFSMRDPFISQAQKLIGSDKLVEFSVPGLYTKTYNIVGSETFIKKHPGAMEKILYALNEGAKYADSHPKKVIEIISRRIQLPKDRVAALWTDMHLAVTLNQGLLTTLQEEAQWAVSIGLVKEGGLNEGRIPDFLTRLDPAPLAKAIPHSVGLIGINPQ